MPDNSTVLRWVSDRPEFKSLYAAAMQIRVDSWCDDLLMIADAEGAQQSAGQAAEAVQRDRLKIDTRKWLMARLAPKKYGDRMDMNLAAEVAVAPRIDLSGLTRDERNQMRALLETNEARLASRN